MWPDELERRLVARAVEAQHPHALGDVVVVGGDRAAVAEGAEVLRGEERERGRRAERARPARRRRSASRPPGRRPRAPARRAPRSPRPARRCRTGARRRPPSCAASAPRCTVSAVTQNVSGSTSQNTGRAPVGGIASAERVEGEGRHDDLVAGPDAERAQRERQRVGAVGHADRVARRRGRRRTRASKASTSGPRMNAPRSSTAAMRASSSARRGASGVRVSNRGTRIGARTVRDRAVPSRATAALAPRRYPRLPVLSPLASLTDPIVEFAVDVDRRARPARHLRADGGRERVHPDPVGDDVPVRRLQRLARASTRLLAVVAGRHRSPTSSAPGSPTRSATTAASTSSRSTARSCTSSPRT